MKISAGQLVAAVVVSFTAGVLVTPERTQGQSEGQTAGAATAPTQPSYMVVEYMKVPEGKQMDWVKTTFRGFPDPTVANFPDLYKRAHAQGDYMSVITQTEQARRIVRTEIWQVLAQTAPAAGMGTK